MIETIKTILRPVVHPLRLFKRSRQVDIYNKSIPKRVEEISTHQPIRVMFYVANVAMWKSDKLLDLLKEDNRFEPIIVSYLYDFDTFENKQTTETEVSSYFISKDVEYHCGFDFTKNSLIPANTFNADVLFYPQPYTDSFRQLPTRGLLSYIPYCFGMEDDMRFYNRLYHNVCWKMFAPTSLHKEIEKKYNRNKGSNVCVVGNPLSDYFYDGHEASSKDWKIQDSSLKRIIWAPHHSILPEDTLDYSNFLEIADKMLELAEKYSEKVQFVFKPHPRLRDKLNKLPEWGKERTDRYFNEWASRCNTNFANGNYVDLFLTSDALIHDCSSFTAEYLYTNKPVMFVTDREEIPGFNEFAKKCFAVHYKGSSMEEIEQFIKDVIDGSDVMRPKRSAFVNQYFKPQDGKTVAEKIYEELSALK